MDDTLVYLKPGEILLDQGEESSNLYWCLQGELKVYKVSSDTIVELGRIKAGELVGELSFIDQKQRSATVKAVSDCQLIQLNYADFEEMLKVQPKWIKKLLDTLTRKVRYLSDVQL